MPRRPPAQNMLSDHTQCCNCLHTRLDVQIASALCRATFQAECMPAEIGGHSSQEFIYCAASMHCKEKDCSRPGLSALHASAELYCMQAAS